MTTREKESYSIHSVENALDVLEALCDEPDEVQISRLSEKLGMTKTSVFRLLATFENRGYVEREEQSGRYRLGISAFEVGQKLLSRMHLLRDARPVMDMLVRNCQESVYLVIQRGTDALFLEKVETPQQVKIASLVGRRYPLHASSAGRIFLAHQTDSELKEYPVTGVLDLNELKEIRECGWSRGQNELGEGVASLSAPLLNSGGGVAGSLCFVLPDYRINKELLEGLLLPNLINAGHTISSKLGYLGHYLRREMA